ncbi:nucleotide pyrophosphohydrolase [Vibrio crassostreae]|uniref:nucleotide pyrophosphohydrolase n=1 Tax=Vibrio crassostreae TaxID=246167 RepID=UPI00104D11F0|nr:nucleotide pyrophosphohydrolase [Vibrio crassostreae]TCT78882.1 NTP pyrophosphatase (non-canonical NTP hydrolase) [Vibrio crassostreae]CAK1878680.1 dCTP diphosphatase [Vibrio crassostreae]CAK2439464.1 dCTP diphosphatase [Vibrio crassostreae]CAK2824898.1 dCTP diphosphatase [Vibrio crassostreae]
MSVNKDSQSLIFQLRKFADERDWNKFHSPKNLSMALSVEVSELLEHFQWLTEDQTKNLNLTQKEKVKEELADIYLYLLRLSDVLEVDLNQVAKEKIILNGEKYPVSKSYGKATKYSDFE